MNQPVDQADVPKRQSGCLNSISAFFVALSVVPLLLFIASQLGQFIFVCELISNFQLFLFLFLLPFPFLLLLMRRWNWAIVLGIATIWSGLLVTHVYWPSLHPPAGEQSLRVMSYNVLGSNRNYPAAIKEINAADPDILVVCEYSRPWHFALQTIHDKYPHRLEVPRWHGFGIAIFSKLPIESEEVLQLGFIEDSAGNRVNITDNPSPVAHFKVDNQQFRVIGFHSLSPTNQERMSIRNQQFKEIGIYISKQDIPTILVGDFNCTTWSYFLKQLMTKAKLFDSRQGIGYQGSWRADFKPFLIPIDHALVSDHIHVHDRKLGGRGGSDHLPVILDFSITPDFPITSD